MCFFTVPGDQLVYAVVHSTKKVIMMMIVYYLRDGKWKT